MFSRGANVIAMKQRHLKAALSITWRGRQPYRGGATSNLFHDGHLQIGPIAKAVRSEKKISIRWERPKSWRVPVRVAHQLEAAGL